MQMNGIQFFGIYTRTTDSEKLDKKKTRFKSESSL